MQSHHSDHQKRLFPLMVAAMGVVFGDIGTSPLYAVKEALFHHPELAQNQVAIYGLLSMIFWTMVSIVLIKYVTFVMRADNEGEGGVLSLMALAERALKGVNLKATWVVILGILGACMFYGEAIITPAISVLSAVEGLEVVSPAFKEYVLPVSLTILIVLFAVQSKGTAAVGKFFGPITILWFIVLAVLGIVHIVQRPDIIFALNPVNMVTFFMQSPGIAMVVIGSVFLVVTGTEALYIDMGHFGYNPIRFDWMFLVMPCLILNYLGQGAMLLNDPSAEVVKNPFFNMAPDWATIPLVILATLATIIASQAVISGAFSLTSQAIQLGYLPRMLIKNTSESEQGQIYIPFINWMLLVLVVIIVVVFKESAKLAAAYGIAVNTTMIVTSLLVSVVMYHVWKWPLWRVVAVVSCFLLIDLTFFAANALKLMNNGWVPLVLGAMVFFIFMTWHRGRKLLRERSSADGIPLKPFMQALLMSPPVRVQGTAVFLNSDPATVPASLLHNLKHNRILHERNIFLSVVSKPVPRIDDEKRMHIDSLGENTYSITVSSGFMEKPNIQRYLQLAQDIHGIPFDLMDTSFFLSRDYVVPSKMPGMALWREHIFAWMHRNSMRSSDYYDIPSNRVVELGTKVEI